MARLSLLTALLFLATCIEASQPYTLDLNDNKVKRFSDATESFVHYRKVQTSTSIIYATRYQDNSYKAYEKYGIMGIMNPLPNAVAYFKTLEAEYQKQS